MSNIIIIKGSARNDGDTSVLVTQLQEISDWDVLDLNDYQILPYDYAHRNQDDDYICLMKHLIATYDIFIMTTPVYWYAMSGVMKTFFDRFTDLLEVEKRLGYQLRNKKMAALSCSAGHHLGDNFWHPFRETAEYLGMKYLGNLHTISGDLDKNELLQFCLMIEEDE